MSQPSVINVDKWIEENQKFFLPPVCNKMMHNTQLKVMYIGGPNQRKDYHHEEGEELFLMVKGDMCLKIVEQGKHKDVDIREGEFFLLPARIPHSPQRQENTVGLVIERERLENETDGLRYYVGDTTEPLFERWFHCYDLGTELAPIIKEYFASEEYKTGKPSPDKLLKELPFKIDEESVVMKPKRLDEWVKENNSRGECVPLVPGKFQFDIKVYYQGESTVSSKPVEHWLWQMEGTSTIDCHQCDMKFCLKKGDSLLVPPNTSFKWKRNADSNALCVVQDGTSK